MDHFERHRQKMDKAQRSFGIAFRLVVGLQILVAVCIVAGMVAFFMHPEAVGQFFGRVASGYQETSR